MSRAKNSQIIVAGALATATPLANGTAAVGVSVKAAREDHVHQISGDMVLANTQTVGGEKTFLNLKLGLRNVANTFTSFFTNANTAIRTYTLQNRDGTIMDNTDYAALSDYIDEKVGVNTVQYSNLIKVQPLRLLGNPSASVANVSEVIMAPRIKTVIPSGAWDDSSSVDEGIDGQSFFDNTYLYNCFNSNKWFRYEKGRILNNYSIVSQVTFDLKNILKAHINANFGAIAVNLDFDYSNAVEGGDYTFLITQFTSAKTITLTNGKWAKGNNVTIPSPFPTATSGAKDLLICKYLGGKMVILNLISNIQTL